MKVSNVKGLANRDGPESCGGARKNAVEALTGESAGWVLSREMPRVRDADPVGERGRLRPMFRFGEKHWYPARSEAPGMHGSNLRENREILRSSQPARWGRIANCVNECIIEWPKSVSGFGRWLKVTTGTSGCLLISARCRRF